jgi:O-antigen ligase
MKHKMSNVRNALSIKKNFLTFAVILTALIFCFFGGAEPNVNFNLGLVFLAGILLIFAVAASSVDASFNQLPVYVKLVIIAPVILPILQLIPLPLGLWTLLPGQELRLEVLSLVGADQSWQPLSLTPSETAYSAAMGMFFSAFLLGLISVSNKHLDYVKLAVIIVTLLGVLVGALQFSGTFPALNFYENAHTNILVGFFANKNHMALILAVTLIMSRKFFDQLRTKNGSLLYSIFSVFLVIAVVATNSRAGIALMCVALLLTFAPTLKGISKKITVTATMFIISAFYYISSSPTFEIVYKRFSDVGEDGRWDFLINSTPLMREFFLLGSGYGSFSSVYMTRESVEALSPVYTNHLHSDFLQLIIEGGILAILALALFGFAIFKSWRAARESETSRDAAWVGLSIVILFGFHSIVDYPMRRPAAVVYFCIGLACLFRAFLPTAKLRAKGLRTTQTA